MGVVAGFVALIGTGGVVDFGPVLGVVLIAGIFSGIDGAFGALFFGESALCVSSSVEIVNSGLLSYLLTSGPLGAIDKVKLVIIKAAAK